MDYLIRRNKEELQSTCYMEIGPGKYSGKHWQKGFIFIWENAFWIAEGIVAKHFQRYDHFSTNDIPREIGTKITKEWSQVSSQIITASENEFDKLLEFKKTCRLNFNKEASKNRDHISSMLINLSIEVDSFYDNEDWVCILGM